MPNQDLSDSAHWDALARYLAGEATAAEADVMRRVLAADPDRAALVAALDEVLRVRDAVAPSPLEVESALARVCARRDAQPAAPLAHQAVVSLAAYRSRWRQPRYVAAAAALLVVAAGLLWRTDDAPEPARTASAPPTQFVTPVGTLDTLSLPDGSRVLLGPGSRLTLVGDFAEGARELTLTGDARFEVVHMESRPFVVHAGIATFRDVGTVFVVRSDVSNGARIVVTEGAVSVASGSNAPSVTLTAGDRAVVGSEGSVRVDRSSAGTDDLSWTTGQLVFRDANLAQVADDIRRWYGLELRVDALLASQRLNVTFDRQSAADVGRTIAAMIGGEAREEGRTVYITPSRTTPPK